jgi:hypothetical protein
MDSDTVNWLYEGDFWLRSTVDTQLYKKPADTASVLAEGKIQEIIKRLKDQNLGIPAFKSGQMSYLNTGNAFWDLFFLSDIGLGIEDISLQEEVEDLFGLQLEDGTFILHSSMKPSYYCISSIVIASLAKMGCQEDPHILRFIDKILKSQRLDGGWHCALNRAVGKKLQDSESCPMENLNVLMLLAQYERFRRDPQLEGAIDLLLLHWKNRLQPWRPYGFGIGSQFIKLQYPATKYGILRVLDVLSQYPYAIDKPEFQDMLSFVLSKAIDGKYYSESVSRSYSEFDFGQKKEPSRWITFLITRIQNRVCN